LGGGGTTQTAAGTKTAGDSPNDVRLHPQLRKAAGTLAARRTAQRDNEAEKENTSGQCESIENELKIL